jgi:3-oxoacyl-[acyl-carrier protein] reductase
MLNGPARVVLVTGASKGVGAEVARRFARADTHVLVHHRDDPEGAAAVAAAIRREGGHATPMAADIADDAEATAMIAAIRSRFGRLDTVVLHACGARLGADPGWAMRLNRDAQRRLASLAIPLMPSGGRIVFVTSHQAHFFPHKGVPKGYATVAASKRAGETALHAMRPAFDRAGIRFSVVSGEMVDAGVAGSGGRDSAPTVDEFAAGIVAAATTRAPGIVYIGGPKYSMAA